MIPTAIGSGWPQAMKRQILGTMTRYAQQRKTGSDLIAKVARVYLASYENQDHNLCQNGEAWLVANLRELRIVFDVGANKGDWSRMAMSLHPDADIHAFEIAPSTRATLRTAADTAIVYDFGLGDKNDLATLWFYLDHSEISTVILAEGLHPDRFESCRVPVRRGDSVCQELGIDRIDFLKVDVEGSEYSVLRGFSDMISKDMVRVIQFEYGVANIFSRFLLKDFYEMLGELPNRQTLSSLGRLQGLSSGR